MTDTPEPEATALMAALPRLKSTTRTGWALIAAIAVCAAAVTIMLLTSGRDTASWGILSGFVGAFGIGAAASWVRKSHERDIMPIIASTMNLTHQKTAPGFFNTIPESFVPRGGQRNCDDLMSGQIADRRFRFAEVKTETGGKNSRVLFDGVVVQVETRAPLPDFLIALTNQTKGFLFFKGNVDVSELARIGTTYSPDREEYGLWSPSAQPGQATEMQSLMQNLIALGPKLSPGSTLYSAACTGGTLFVALRHNRELFKIGGVFADDTQIMNDIRRATSELRVPFALAAEVIRAEEAMHAATTP